MKTDGSIGQLGLQQQNTTDWEIETTELHFSQFWSLEDQEQGIGRFGFS